MREVAADRFMLPANHETIGRQPALMARRRNPARPR